MELKSFIGLDEAIRKGSKYKPRYKSERVTVSAAVGRYSAEDVVSPSDFPRFDRSAMDGYALRSEDTISSSRTNPSIFRLKGKLFPSSSEALEVGKGEAVKVMTGSRIPKGTDSVAMLEDSSEKGNELSVYVTVRKFQNVSKRGEDIRKGFRIIGRGEMVEPPHVAALLECGIEEIDVLSISIGIFSTGDELVSGTVRNSTQPFIQAYFRRKGFQTVGYGVVGDDEELIEKALNGVEEDLIIVTGGTGPGEKDLLPTVIERKGRFVFRGLRIRPGRTTSFGFYNRKPVFMVSGLPVAALIASENVILKLICEWYELIEETKEFRTGMLTRSIVITLGLRSFVRVKAEYSGELTRVIPTRVTGSGVIYSLIDADGILVIDENSEGIEEGETVRIEVLRW